MNAKLLVQLGILRVYNIKPNFSELARLYGLDRRTVKKYYEGYPGKPKHRSKPSSLDKYKTIIKEKLLIRGSTIKGVYKFLYNKIDNSIGSYSNFHRYVKMNNLANKHNISGYPRFETKPGQQVQVDWKEDIRLANKHGDIFTFQILGYKFGYSRYCQLFYKITKSRQDVLDCLIKAFKATGGVPQEILFDNMASVVDLKGKQRIVNIKLKTFAKDFNFKICLAKPRHPFTKGKIEAMNRFISRIYSYQREFETEEDLENILFKIQNNINQEVCQATNVSPILLFQKEKEYLQNLPNEKVIESYLDHDRQVTVQKDSLIHYKGRKYSVPVKYIGKRVQLTCFNNATLQIYYNTELIATHVLSEKMLNYLPDHYKELLSMRIASEDLVNKVAKNNLRQMDTFL